MIPRDEETDFTKLESSGTGSRHHDGNASSFKQPTTSSSSITTSSWTRLKDPRIVRVSRAFGGKDRHSKVCTVRGLRDRRVRLSVPTAIQLYDLQDRLGLNQPSKVVDWLLNAAKNEIDELPPLQIPQGTFSHCLIDQPMLHSSSTSSRSSNVFGAKSSKDVVSGETSDRDHAAATTWTRGHDLENNTNNNQESSYNVSGGNDFPSRQNLSSAMMMMMSNSSAPYNPFARWDPSSLSLSHHPPRSHGLTAHHHQNQDNVWHGNNFCLVPLQYHQPGISTQSYFPDTGSGFDPKQMNLQSSHLSTSSLSSPPVDHESTTLSVRPISFNMNN